MTCNVLMGTLNPTHSLTLIISQPVYAPVYVSVVAGLSLVLVSGHAVSYNIDDELRPAELPPAEIV